MVGRTIAGRYTIRATIGSGGMGFVYRATQSPIEREVALKVLRVDLAHQDGIAERFTREARAASRIQHPNAITIYEFGEDDGILYLAMELLYGETLRQRLRREPKLEPEHSLDIFDAMAGALGAAHRVGVVHRDLKPDNIFLAQFEGHGEVVKVLDFGLAKLLDRAAGADEGLVTDVNLRLGTPRYMAPEQALGLQPIDARCDVYALGLLLFEMLAGRAPFLGDDGMEVLAQRLRREAPRLSQTAPDRGYSEHMDALLSAMLERDRERRPADANEVLARLRELRKSGMVYEGEDPVLDAPDLRASNPNIQPRPRRTAAVAGYPIASGPGSSAGLTPSNSAQRAPAVGDLDDFDKPTVVITSRDEFTPPPEESQPAPSYPAPAPPAPYIAPSYAPAAGQPSGTVMTATQPRERRASGPQLPRRVVIALVLLALGAPLVALLIRWYQGRGDHVDQVEPTSQVIPARPEEAPRPTASPMPEAPTPGPAAPGPAKAPEQREQRPAAVKDPPPKAPEQKDQKDQKPRLCYIRVESTPPGARVERDGAVVGTTPFVDSMPYGTTPLRYRVSLEGHEPFEKTVTPEHRRTLSVALRPLSGARPPAQPAQPAQKAQPQPAQKAQPQPAQRGKGKPPAVPTPAPF